jgi:predicted phosphohydrolase
MMLVRPFSDLHVEFWPSDRITRIIGQVVPPLSTDKETVAIIAGDLGLAHRHETWLRVLDLLAKRFLAVIYVEGNHFFYDNNFFGRIHELRKSVSLPENVYFFENESVEINNILFIGATLWTDFQGKDHFKMQYARKSMSDFEVIRKPDGNVLKPEDTVDLFRESKDFIFNTLRNAGNKKTIVVTHHGISPLSMHERYRGGSLAYAFISDLSREIIDCGPDLWVHGHTHDTCDYLLGKTRVIVNPYGYRDLEVNRQFIKDLVVTV